MPRVNNSKLRLSNKILKKKISKTTVSVKKHCRFCLKNGEFMIDYKNIGLLKHFITERCKILPSRISGNCAKHQREITREIKNARIMALLPYVNSY
jgi:small subunit ribosomal protein S18